MLYPARMRASVGILGIVSVVATACGGAGATGDAAAGDTGPGDAAIGDAPGRAVGLDVATDDGPVHGVGDADLAVFKGIPYAAPPTGPGRFAPPARPTPWTTPRDASAFGPACPQGPALPQAEDCLSLNVWAHADARRRPVLVWIHGGGFVEGSSRLLEYDGAALARTADVVVISINYRVGLLGWLTLPQLAAPDGGQGNWGLRDQVVALTWVHRNAAAFGGDPARVMIAGESAGGASVCDLLAVPSAQGLFHAAAMESGLCRMVLALDQPTGTFPSAHAVGLVTAVALGCTTGDVAGCLRGKTTAEVLAAQAKLAQYDDAALPVGPTLPVVDGVFLDQRPMAAIRAGRGAVPIIAGANRDDASVFVGQLTTPTFSAYLDKIAAPHKAALLALYPTATFGELGAETAYATDVAFACPALALATANPSAAPRYLYQLDRPIPNGPNAVLGAVHGYDFVLLFGTFATWGITPGPSERALSTTMQQGWGALAHGLPPTAWPAAAGGDPSFLGLDDPAAARAGFRGGRCAQLAALGGILAE
jgi:para-nitrobenzyl esterase